MPGGNSVKGADRGALLAVPESASQDAIEGALTFALLWGNKKWFSVFAACHSRDGKTVKFAFGAVPVPLGANCFPVTKHN